MAEWLRRLTRKPKVRTAVGSNPTLDSLVAVRNTSPGRPEPCEGNLVAVAGSCGGLIVKHPWPLLEISLSDFRGLATLNINTYLPTYLATAAIDPASRGPHCSTHCCTCCPVRVPGWQFHWSEILSISWDEFSFTLHPYFNNIQEQSNAFIFVLSLNRKYCPMALDPNHRCDSDDG